ncbi:MAG: hypothetical protein MZU79_00115 [Anaerotruncus sp.]|nr:hypothetical protein [Anaerotruncus sp.]
MIYVCYDNEAYMNTGIQRSSSHAVRRQHHHEPGRQEEHRPAHAEEEHGPDSRGATTSRMLPRRVPAFLRSPGQGEAGQRDGGPGICPHPLGMPHRAGASSPQTPSSTGGWP